MAQIPAWPWVRTQIHPDAQGAARRVHYKIGWTLPGVYAALLHYMLLRYDPDELAQLIVDGLRQPPDDVLEEVTPQ